ncbi:bifunctional ADP-dependent NAD(P)H-hydrate dehydratase/NAD(P)H-hydrate epimerase [Paramagnetospirillum kuznetsovii]|uniref:Bifunctional NAD(P)H-hydrate repair enzyme n=1 Tax=Paramagnetospirillum kuznetsovii TaxID=2053833 RepID=A0A364NWG5_9PROT|nr:NAD(P)H-hydrate dehydratase [Paramagnetospirillum kuznetsovii]RAU21402.1 bifunctional ADP-dependent NAD(P)H-hydrate dehydratase/NAD(P)H-hydrate epimerase [Paramagnetospirillum kuznetsovii]
MVNELLTVSQMYQADRLAMAAGVPGERLMEAAGWAVAREVRRRFPKGRVAILCGPGNNGGDGFVAARLLERDGWAVRLALLGRPEALKGDAAVMASRWRGAVETLSPGCLDRCDVVVDALFGAGLARGLDGIAKAVIEETLRRRLPVIAVDVPSGVHGDSGQVLGLAPDCVATITFFRKKPGHCLVPGRAKCGEVVVADIGIPASVLDEIQPSLAENGPGVWRLPALAPDGHKYARGHVLVVGGGAMTGAARLAARAARRIGAGLVTIAAPAEALVTYRAGDPGAIVIDAEPFDAVLADTRRNAVVIGPGGGVGEGLADRTLAALAAGRACVVDADALTSFSEDPDRLFKALSASCVLTPHDGEFTRLFGAATGSRLERAQEGARRSGAVLLLKGPDTVVAHPDGRATITTDASPALATAGSGDVLAGLIAGLIAQGMPAYEAASAAAWLHGQAGAAVGPGLISEDLSEALPRVLRRLRGD